MLNLLPSQCRGYTPMAEETLDPEHQSQGDTKEGAPHLVALRRFYQCWHLVPYEVFVTAANALKHHRAVLHAV